MNTLLLARLQFAFTITFHYIYPPMSIGLGALLVLTEGTYLITGDKLYHDITRFWARIFGLIFAIGVATGVVMEFEFGTNWAAYSRFVGDVFGSALASEGIFAFFLESGFLAVLLFGWNKVSKGMHFLSTVFVAAGAHFSAIWIVVANSWMQTPAGYHLVNDGARIRAEITDFWSMVFSPSSLARNWHVFMGAWQAGAFLVISVSAFYLLKKRHEDFAKASLKIALALGLMASLGQLWSGHESAEIVARYQPEKLAALEGHFAEQAPADIHLFGWVNEKKETVADFGLRIPGMLSWLVSGDRTHPVPGLKSFPPENRPPVNIVFQAYHLMVAIGMLLILLSSAGIFAAWRGTLWNNRLLLRIFVLSVLLPAFANQLGWFTAEVGRQPWIVYHLMRTSEGLSKVVSGRTIAASLVLFTFVYALLFAVFIYLLDQKIRRGPEEILTPQDILTVSDKERV
jgi:cytochrome d ubiquinol oxidase subunit I